MRTKDCPVREGHTLAVLVGYLLAFVNCKLVLSKVWRIPRKLLQDITCRQERGHHALQSESAAAALLYLATHPPSLQGVLNQEAQHHHVFLPWLLYQILPSDISNCLLYSIRLYLLEISPSIRPGDPSNPSYTTGDACCYYREIIKLEAVLAVHRHVGRFRRSSTLYRPDDNHKFMEHHKYDCTKESSESIVVGIWCAGNQKHFWSNISSAGDPNMYAM